MKERVETGSVYHSDVIKKLLSYKKHPLKDQLCELRKLLKERNDTEFMVRREHVYITYN